MTNNHRPSRGSVKSHLNRLQILEEDKKVFENFDADKNYSTPAGTDSTESKPRKITHYYEVQYEKEDGTRICKVCGKRFKPYNPQNVYCSWDCYSYNANMLKRNWNKKNRERVNYLKRERRKKLKAERPPKVEFYKRSKHILRALEYRKCTIIKKELVKMELLSFQCLCLFTRMENKKKYTGNDFRGRYGIDEGKVEFIKERLEKLDLPYGEAIPVEFPADPEIDVWEPKALAIDYSLKPTEYELYLLEHNSTPEDITTTPDTVAT